MLCYWIVNVFKSFQYTFNINSKSKKFEQRNKVFNTLAKSILQHRSSVPLVLNYDFRLRTGVLCAEQILKSLLPTVG